jgi:eukaryotic-like serine/threonine-protein kinase
VLTPKLHDRLGSGGYGEVFSATTREDGEEVAFKRLLAQHANDADIRRRFAREVRLQRRLSHPHIMPIYDADLEADLPWYTMPLAKTDLAEPGQRNAGGVDFIKEVFVPVAEAVAAAHDGGVMHRDITPHNVLQLKDDRWVLSDFGVGREIDRTTTAITRSREGIGTLDYMSPEQYRDPKSCDERTDIFAMGKLLLYLIVGGVYDPFRPAALPANQFIAVLDRALQTDPDHRYQSAAEMGRAFLDCLEPEPGAWEALEQTVARLTQEFKEGSATDSSVDRLIHLLAQHKDDRDVSRQTVP